MEYSVFRKKASILNGADEIGYIQADFDKLCDLFGNPIIHGTNSYTDYEWDIMLENGHAVGIMNWKNGKKFLGSDVAVNKISSWRVVGFWDSDYDDVKKIVGGAKILNLTLDLKAKNKDDLVKRLKTIVLHIEEGKTEAQRSSNWHSWKLEEVEKTSENDDYFPKI